MKVLKPSSFGARSNPFQFISSPRRTTYRTKSSGTFHFLHISTKLSRSILSPSFQKGRKTYCPEGGFFEDLQNLNGRTGRVNSHQSVSFLGYHKNFGLQSNQFELRQRLKIR